MRRWRVDGAVRALALAAAVGLGGVAHAQSGAEAQRLADALQSPTVAERRQAAEALQKLGAGAKDAVPALIGALQDRDGLVRFNAAQALGAVGEPALPELVKAYRAGDAGLRYHITAALQRMGARGAEELRKLNQTQDNVVRDGPRPIPPRDGGATPAPKPAVVNAGGGQEFAGTLTPQDPFDRQRPRSRHKAHTVPMKAGATYKIDLESTEFDCWLRVEDEQGNHLVSDDDGGGNLNSRLIFIPPRDGNYRVIATTFGPNMTGAYRLTVRSFGGNNRQTP